MININEVSWVLTGRRCGRTILARRRWRTVGGPAHVEFPWQLAMERELTHRDLVGMIHTHPSFTADPSSTDICTMQAWTMALGKPLICVIRGTDGTKAWMFDNDESVGRMSRAVFCFSGLVAVIDNIKDR